MTNGLACMKVTMAGKADKGVRRNQIVHLEHMKTDNKDVVPDLGHGERTRACQKLMEFMQMKYFLTKVITVNRAVRLNEIVQISMRVCLDQTDMWLIVSLKVNG